MLKTKVKSHKSNLDKIRKHFQETGGSSDNRWFSIKAPERGNEAKVIIRVLPPWGKAAEGFFYYTCAQHFGFSIGGQNRALDCPESMTPQRGPCPICKFISRLKNSDNPSHIKLANRIRANRRYFVNIIDREEPDAIKIYGTNKKFIEAILDASDDPDVGDITDPRSGRDLIVVRRGSGLKTRYSYRVRTKETPVAYESKDMYKLDVDVSNWMDYDAMVNIVRDNYSDELNEVGLKLKPKKSKLKVVKKDEEEEVEDEEVSEEDSDNEEVDEEEDVDIDEDEEEDE